MTTETDRTTQVFRVFIKASPQKIWDAITDPKWNARFGYGAPAVYELRPGGTFRSTASDEMRQYSVEQGFDMPDVIIDGEVLESDPPRRLVHTWRMLMDPSTATEPFTTLTYEIAELKTQPGVCKLTLTHDVTAAPSTGAMISGDQDEMAGGGWPMVLSDLKTLLETGSAFRG